MTNECFASLEDYRSLARTRLPAAVFDYVDCGACDEVSTRRNRSDFDDLALRPLVLRNVSEPCLAAQVLGWQFPQPLGIAPMAFHRLVHSDGEIATARAANRLNLPMIVSCMSSIPIEDIAAESPHTHLWLQTYIFKNKDVTRELVRRAEEAGYEAIVLTTGCPAPGKRDKNIRNAFALPEGVHAANFQPRNVVVHNNPIHSVEGADLDPSATWRDVEWLRRQTQLPILLKGIMNPNDALQALSLDVSGIIVSNHGGRQLDTTESTICALPDIAAAVGGRLPLLIDSGFRRGTDILKAIALGADTVLVGRPVLWALALGGESGVVAALKLLGDEFRLAMQLAGCDSLSAIRRAASDILRSRAMLRK